LAGSSSTAIGDLRGHAGFFQKLKEGKRAVKKEDDFLLEAKEKKRGGGGGAGTLFLQIYVGWL